MPGTARFTGGSEAIQLAFVERVHTPIELMEYAIELHLNGLSLGDTVITLERFGIKRAKSTIHNWVQKSDLEPESGRSPDKVALDETVVKVEGERFWLYAAVNPETNQILHVGLYSTRNTAVTKMFLSELGVSDVGFLGGDHSRTISGQIIIPYHRIPIPAIGSLEPVTDPADRVLQPWRHSDGYPG